MTDFASSLHGSSSPQASNSKSSLTDFASSLHSPSQESAQPRSTNTPGFDTNIGNVTFGAPQPFQSKPPDDLFSRIGNTFNSIRTNIIDTASNFPGTVKTLSELQIDPANLKANPLNAITSAWNSIKDAFQHESQAINNLFDTPFKGPAPASKKLNNLLEATVVGPANIAFSPITALFAAANDIPVLGSVSKLLTLPFQTAGEGAAKVSEKLIDLLPLSEGAKNNIKPAIGEIFSLAAMISLGKAVEVGSKKYESLVKKYGPEDAKTILEKAQELAETKKAKETPTTFTPEEAKREVVSSDLADTPLGQEILKTAFQAEVSGHDIQITPDSTSSLKTPGGSPVRVEVIESTKPTNIDTISNKIVSASLKGLQKEAKSPIYSSAETFASEKLKTGVGSLIGEIDPNKVITRDPIDIGTVEEYKKRIQANEPLDPIYATESKGEITTTDGSQRITAYQQLGQKAPIVITKFETAPEGLKTVGEFYRESKVANQATPPKEAAKVESKTPDRKQPQKEAEAKETTAPKVSKIAKEIDAKAVEKKLTEGFSELAGYDPKTVKEQARLTTKLMNSDPATFEAIIEGKKPLPKEINPSYMIKAAEDYLDAIIDPKEQIEFLQKLAKSPLISETSGAAQTLRFAAERDPYSPVSLITKLENDKRAVIEQRYGKPVNEIVKDTVKEIEKEVKKAAPSKSDWNSFIKSIQC